MRFEGQGRCVDATKKNEAGFNAKFREYCGGYITTVQNSDTGNTAIPLITTTNTSGGGTTNATAGTIADGLRITFSICDMSKSKCNDLDGCVCPTSLSCVKNGNINYGQNCGGKKSQDPIIINCCINGETQNVTSTRCNQEGGSIGQCSVTHIQQDQQINNQSVITTPIISSEDIHIQNLQICTPSQTRLSEKCGNPCRSDQKSLEKCNILGTLWEPVTPAQCTDASTSCTDTKQPTLSKCSEAICSDSDDCICPINQCNRTIAKNGYDCGGDKSAEAVVAKPQFDPTIQKDTVKPLLGQCTTDKCTDADGCVCRDNCVKSFVGSGDFDKTCGGVKPAVQVETPCTFGGVSYKKGETFCSPLATNKILKCEGNNSTSLVQICDYRCENGACKFQPVTVSVQQSCTIKEAGSQSVAPSTTTCLLANWQSQILVTCNTGGIYDFRECPYGCDDRTKQCKSKPLSTAGGTEPAPVTETPETPPRSTATCRRYDANDPRGSIARVGQCDNRPYLLHRCEQDRYGQTSWVQDPNCSQQPVQSTDAYLTDLETMRAQNSQEIAKSEEKKREQSLNQKNNLPACAIDKFDNDSYAKAATQCTGIWNTITCHCDTGSVDGEALIVPTVTTSQQQQASVVNYILNFLRNNQIDVNDLINGINNFSGVSLFGFNIGNTFPNVLGVPAINNYFVSNYRNDIADAIKTADVTAFTTLLETAFNCPAGQSFCQEIRNTAQQMYENVYRTSFENGQLEDIKNNTPLIQALAEFSRNNSANCNDSSSLCRTMQILGKNLDSNQINELTTLTQQQQNAENAREENFLNRFNVPWFGTGSTTVIPPTAQETISQISLDENALANWINAASPTERGIVAQLAILAAQMAANNSERFILIFGETNFADSGNYVRIAEAIFRLNRTELLDGSLTPAEIFNRQTQFAVSINWDQPLTYPSLERIFSDVSTKEEILFFYSINSAAYSEADLVTPNMISVIQEIFPGSDILQMIQESYGTGKPISFDNTQYLLGADGEIYSGMISFDCTGLTDRILEKMYGLEDRILDNYPTAAWLANTDWNSSTAVIESLNFKVSEYGSLNEVFYAREGFGQNVILPPGTVIIFSTPGVMNHAVIFVNSSGSSVPVMMESSTSLDVDGPNIMVGPSAVADRLFYLNEHVYDGDGRRVIIYTPINEQGK